MAFEPLTDSNTKQALNHLGFINLLIFTCFIISFNLFCFLFNSVVLKPFCRITRRVDELSIALWPLYQKYCEPLNELDSVPDANTKRRLFDHLQPYLTAALNETFKLPSQPTLETNKEKVRRKGNARKSGFGVACDELDFHMSVSAKYLLISAFLASRNPATLDAALFDSTGGSDNRKRKRK